MHAILYPRTRLVFSIWRYIFRVLFSMPRLQVQGNHKPACAMTLERDQPAGQANASYIMPTARRLLAEAHQTMLPESWQLHSSVTIMDMILDHRLLIRMADLPADGRHRSPVRRNCAPRCQADVDAYWAQQEDREFVSPTVSKNIAPPVSAERSTMAWPPSLDGDEVWDCAS